MIQFQACISLHCITVTKIPNMNKEGMFILGHSFRMLSSWLCGSLDLGSSKFGCKTE